MLVIKLPEQELEGNIREVTSSELIGVDPLFCSFFVWQFDFAGLVWQIVVLANLQAVVAIDELALPCDEQITTAFSKDGLFEAGELLGAQRRTEIFEWRFHAIIKCGAANFRDYNSEESPKLSDDVYILGKGVGYANAHHQ